MICCAVLKKLFKHIVMNELEKYLKYLANSDIFLPCPQHYPEAPRDPRIDAPELRRSYNIYLLGFGFIFKSSLQNKNNRVYVHTALVLV